MEEVLLVEDIAEILHIKTNTIHGRRWQEKSRCPLIKHGKRLYAIPDEFWKWFRQKN